MSEWNLVYEGWKPGEEPLREVLTTLFEWLDYPFEPAMIPRNVEYYLRRTSHGSTLSAIINSWVQARSDPSAHGVGSRRH